MRSLGIVTCNEDPDRVCSANCSGVRRFVNASYATSDIFSQCLIHNELAFSKFTQEGLRSHTSMADSVLFTGDFELTRVTTGTPMSVPNPPRHIPVRPIETIDQR